MQIFGEGLLCLLMQQGPVKVVKHLVDVVSPEHERWAHRTFGLGFVLTAH